MSPTTPLASPSAHRLGGAEPSRAEYDVVVVGARVAGAATAMLLARRGLRVLCVDRAAEGSDTLSTHSLVRGGVLQLSRWGLLDRLRAAGTPRATSVRFHYGDEPVALDVTGHGDVDGLYSPRRTVIDPLLVDAAREAGVEVCHRVPVAGPVTEHGRVTGVRLGRGDGDRVVRARWVVGADGIRSGVAAAVGAPVLRAESVTAAVAYAFWSGLPDDAIVNLYDVPGCAVGIVPTNGGQANVWVAVTPEVHASTLRGNVREGYHRLLSAHPTAAALLRGATCDGGYRSFPGTPGYLRAAHGDGWALVGDAGYFKDPVSAHGITDALIDAELLADALARVLLDGADADDELGRYQGRRDEMAALLMPPIARLAGFELDGPGALSAFRDVGVALRREVELVADLSPAPA
jgi:flavin-dependent dehydrogenase